MDVCNKKRVFVPSKPFEPSLIFASKAWGYPIRVPKRNSTLLTVMEQRTFRNVNNCLNTNIYSYLETSGGQSSNPYLNAVHFFNTRVK